MVDATTERDVAVRLPRMPDHDQPLMMRPADADPLVQEHLAAGPLDRLPPRWRFCSSLNWNLLGASAISPLTTTPRSAAARNSSTTSDRHHAIAGRHRLASRRKTGDRPGRAPRPR